MSCTGSEDKALGTSGTFTDMFTWVRLRTDGAVESPKVASSFYRARN